MTNIKQLTDIALINGFQKLCRLPSSEQIRSLIDQVQAELDARGFISSVNGYVSPKPRNGTYAAQRSEGATFYQ